MVTNRNKFGSEMATPKRKEKEREEKRRKEKKRLVEEEGHGQQRKEQRTKGKSSVSKTDREASREYASSKHL